METGGTIKCLPSCRACHYSLSANLNPCPKLKAMVDVCAGLSSLSFEYGLTEDEKELLHLRARSAGLTFCGSAHAAFLCKLVHSLRCVIKKDTANRGSLESGEDGDLCVGILGMGHMGKQLLLCLLENSGIKPSHIKISTRRPESAVEFIQAGVECFFDNRRMAAWADVLFLCCLPSHLPKVCADLHSHLSKDCLVYSFTSGVPVTRLAQLLGHNFILKPQYDFVTCDTADVWLSCTHLTTAWADPLLIDASCPLTMSGGISLNLNWVCAVLYSLLNICTSASLESSEALSLINSILQEKWPHAVELNAHSFISASYASSLHTEEPFPWISLADVQSKKTPLLCFLSSSKSMQQCISAAYKSLLETPAKLFSTDACIIKKMASQSILKERYTTSREFKDDKEREQQQKTQPTNRTSPPPLPLKKGTQPQGHLRMTKKIKQ